MLAEIFNVNIPKRRKLTHIFLREMYPFKIKTKFQISFLQLFKRQPHKMIKHTQAIRQLLPTNFFSVFDYFVGLVLKGLTHFMSLVSFLLKERK